MFVKIFEADQLSAKKAPANLSNVNFRKRKKKHLMRNGSLSKMRFYIKQKLKLNLIEQYGC